MTTRTAPLLFTALLVAACSGDRPGTLLDGGASLDSGPADASLWMDAGQSDASAADAQAPDAAPPDMGFVDAGAQDAASMDAMSVDGGGGGTDAMTSMDGGGPDAMTTVDGGSADAMTTVDGGGADAMPVDGGSTDAMTTVDGGSTDAMTTVDGGSMMDGGTMPDGGMACTVSGDYRFSLMGMQIFFRFDAMGRWFAAQSAAELTTNPIFGGNYTYMNGIFTINDSGSTGCTPNQTGVYTVAFSPTCDAFTLTQNTDACAGRGMTLNGGTFMR